MVNPNDNNVFIFWVGKEYKVIKFLRALIYHHSAGGKNYTVHFINHENIKDYVNRIPDYFWKLSLTHQADWLRVQVICKWGGLWLDSDTIVMSDLSEVFDILKTKEGFLIDEPRKKTSILINGVFASRPSTRLMLEWKNKMEILLESKSKIKWTEIGEHILQKIRFQHSGYLSEYLILNAKETVYPISWGESYKEFIEKPYENYKNLTKDFQPFVMVTSLIYREAEKLSEEEILTKTPMSYFIRKSYQS
jgi:hypothetical protein